MRCQSHVAKVRGAPEAIFTEKQLLKLYLVTTALCQQRESTKCPLVIYIFLYFAYTSHWLLKEKTASAVGKHGLYF